MRRLLEQRGIDCDYFRKALIACDVQTSYGVQGVSDT